MKPLNQRQKQCYKHPKKSPPKLLKKQQGVVLVISLIFLVTITLIAVSSLRNTSLEEKMSGNYKSCQVAFQSAEAAMRSGEDWIQSQIDRPNVSTSNQTGSNVWDFNAPSLVAGQPNWWDQVSASWWANDDNATEYSAAINGVATNPRYVIEEQTYLKDSLNVGLKSDNSGRVFYRVTARGSGASAMTKSVVQSNYTRRF